MKGYFNQLTFILFLMIVTSSCIKDNTIQLPPTSVTFCNKDLDVTLVVDIDGNPYYTVVIRNKEYMLDFLKTTRYNDGTPIENIEDNQEWAGAQGGAWSYYRNEKDSYPTGYASIPKLYNWHAIAAGNLCPKGWRVISDGELTEYDIILSSDFKKYIPCNGRLNHPNEITGWRIANGDFQPDDQYPYYILAQWTATEASDSTAWSRKRNIGSTPIREAENKNAGMTCQCVRDL
ncbi:MAG: fibrobacter succinogenes major paralogous domain-containing protein [Chitinophagales bacterium]|nr:fibrobacter succinogenes major paralogous domain-containing protein [Chitinophagales bacterium]